MIVAIPLHNIIKENKEKRFIGFQKIAFLKIPLWHLKIIKWVKISRIRKNEATNNVKYE